MSTRIGECLVVLGVDVTGWWREPDGELRAALDSAFGSFDDFKAKLMAAGTGQLARAGRGWCPTVEPGGDLHGQPGQPDLQLHDTAVGRRRVGARLLPQIPEWQPDYIDAWWNTVNWPKIAQSYAAISEALSASQPG